MMDARILNHRVSIERKIGTLDDYGQETLAWETVATVAANIRPIGGRELMQGLAMNSTLTHTVLVRYQATLMPPATTDAWRIVYPTASGTRYLEISGTRNLDERRQWIVFDCTEGPSDGSQL